MLLKSDAAQKIPCWYSWIKKIIRFYPKIEMRLIKNNGKQSTFDVVTCLFIRGGGTPCNGLYVGAPPERGTFFRLQVYKRAGSS